MEDWPDCHQILWSSTSRGWMTTCLQKSLSPFLASPCTSVTWVRKGLWQGSSYNVCMVPPWSLATAEMEKMAGVRFSPVRDSRGQNQTWTAVGPTIQASCVTLGQSLLVCRTKVTGERCLATLDVHCRNDAYSPTASSCLSRAPLPSGRQVVRAWVG